MDEGRGIEWEFEFELRERWLEFELFIAAAHHGGREIFYEL